MTDPLEQLNRAVDALDETALEEEEAVIRERVSADTQRLTQILDALELKRRRRGEANGQVPTARLGAHQDIAERLRDQPVPGPSQGDAESPRGTEAARRVMQEGGDWNAKRLHAELERRGWVNPDAKHPLKATETALTRLHTKYHEVERVGRGLYRHKSAPRDPNLLTPSGSAEP